MRAVVSREILTGLVAEAGWWEGILARVAGGKSLRDEAKNWAVGYGDFRRWIDGDETRKKQYEDAIKYFAEAKAFETLAIADGAKDVGKAKLRVGAIQWLVSKLDREKFGDQVKVEHAGVPVLNFVMVGEPAKVEKVINPELEGG